MIWTRTTTPSLVAAPPRAALGLTLAVGLAVPTTLLPRSVHAGEGAADGAQGPEDPATSAPIIVVSAPPAPTPAPAPAPAAFQPPPPAYVPAEPGTLAPSPMLVDPQIAALKHRRNSGIGMTISGYTLFGTSYLISALVGTISIDYARDVGGSGTYGRRMLIPIAGPFMAIPRADSATGGLFTGMVGVVQVAGFVLGTAGAIRLGRANRDLRLMADAGGLTLKF